MRKTVYREDRYLPASSTLIKFIIAVFIILISQKAIAANNPADVIPNILNAAQVSTQYSTANASVLREKTALQTNPYNQPAIPGAELIKFKLTNIRIEGSTIYSQTDFNPLVQSYLNREISLADILNLTQAITNKYRNAGYIISRATIPPQVINKKTGVVRIQIVEGFVSKTTVQGKTGRAKSKIQAYADRILASRPLTLPVLERSLLLINDIPGVSARAVLTPSHNVPTSADLTVDTNLQHFHGYAGYNNYGTRYIGPLQFVLGAGVSSLFMPGDDTTAQLLTTSRTHELRFFELDHSELLGSNGLQWSFGGYYSTSVPGFLLEAADITNRAQSAYTDFAYPVIRSRTRNLTVHAMFDYYNNKATIFGQPFYYDRLRPIQLMGDYDFLDHWFGINAASLVYRQGLNIFNASQSGELSRPFGDSAFTKFNFNASHLQPFNKYFSALVAIQTQYAFTPLLVSEQYSFGGPNFGRGFDPSVIIGDRGVAGKAELHLDTTPDLRVLHAVEYYVFYDTGVIWNINAVGQAGRAEANSTGIGAKLFFNSYLQGNFFLAQPLQQPARSSISSVSEAYTRQIRGYFQIMALI